MQDTLADILLDFKVQVIEMTLDPQFDYRNMYMKT